ncbi:serine hydrolase domain-containing protein [Yoonia litorea]|uniref:serine hydrolase domain-containing protein n=1 Tax=Yoonia litorea TaxID=1123755 RepID=UPI0010426190|nr:serine hydrolase [Yoonia litorea]
MDRFRMFRVASISKIVIGQTLAQLCTKHRVAWDSDVSSVLGWPLCNPEFPDIPISIGALAAHTAGLDDQKGYLLPPDQTLQAFFTSNRFGARPSGTYFDYANLGYLVLAEVIEKLSGTDLPQACSHMIPDDGGFNWIGVPDTRRADALPTFRHDGDGFAAQIDDPAVMPPPAVSVGRFSPQGGLRLSLDGMLTLAEALRDADKTVLWRDAQTAGNDLGGVFEQYGAGLQIFQNPAFYPRPLIGHFGNAYGFKGGVWYDAKADLAFAYALNGLELGDEDDSFSETERKIFASFAMMGDE